MNIFYVFDSVCQQSVKAGFTGYTDLIGKNLSSIVESVAPSGPKGNVNVAGTKKVRDKTSLPHTVLCRNMDLGTERRLANDIDLGIVAVQETLPPWCDRGG